MGESLKDDAISHGLLDGGPKVGLIDGWILGRVDHLGEFVLTKYV